MGEEDKYAEAKAKLKLEMLENGERYPTSMNGLNQGFLVDRFAPLLDREDLEWFINARNEAKSNGKKKWFPAFRSKVGCRFFPEFRAGYSEEIPEDFYEQELEELLARKEDELTDD